MRHHGVDTSVSRSVGGEDWPDQKLSVLDQILVIFAKLWAFCNSFWFYSPRNRNAKENNFIKWIGSVRVWWANFDQKTGQQLLRIKSAKFSNTQFPIRTQFFALCVGTLVVTFDLKLTNNTSEQYRMVISTTLQFLEPSEARTIVTINTDSRYLSTLSR